MNVSFVRLLLKVQLECDVPDRFALFGMRSSFMSAFRHVVGCVNNDCATCAEAGVCPYQLVFGQNLTPDPDALRRFQKPPLPFIFQLPVLPSLPNRGKLIDIGLTIVGHAINQLPFFLEAVRRILSGDGNVLRGKLLEAVCVDTSGNRYPVRAMSGGAGTSAVALLTVEGMVESSSLSTTMLTIEVITPLRINRDGKPLRTLDFSILARTLMRRVSSLCYYYGGSGIDLDFRWLAEQSESIKCLEESWRWSDIGPGRAGLTGTMTCSGDLLEFFPLLLASEYFHVGKGASFGLGRIRLKKPQLQL